MHILLPNNKLAVTIERPRKGTPQLNLAFEENAISITGGKTETRLPYYDMIGIAEEKISERFYKVQINSFPRRRRFFGGERRRIETFEMWIELGTE